MLETKNPAGAGGARDRANAIAGTPVYNASRTVLKGVFSPRSSHRETANDYRAVIATLSDCRRVIVCRDALLLIVQRTDGERVFSGVTPPNVRVPVQPAPGPSFFGGGSGIPNGA